MLTRFLTWAMYRLFGLLSETVSAFGIIPTWGWVKTGVAEKGQIVTQERVYRMLEKVELSPMMVRVDIFVNGKLRPGNEYLVSEGLLYIFGLHMGDRVKIVQVLNNGTREKFEAIV